MMAEVDARLVQTEGLIARLEDVMLALVTTELDIHEQRLRQYQVEAQLAKVRILDRSLQTLNPDEEVPVDPAPEQAQSQPSPEEGSGDETI